MRVWLQKFLLTTSVGTKKGRSSSSSNNSSSTSSSSQEEVQKIDGEGDAVMHMNNFPEQHLTKEYKLSISTKLRGSVMNNDDST